MKSVVVFAAVAVSVIACADDPSTPSDHMKISESCLKTQCDELQDDGNSACNACTDACFSASYDCDPSSACEDSCSPRECSDYDQSTCADEGWKVVQANDPSSDVESACDAFLQHISSCGYQSNGTSADCSRYAANESPDAAVPAYQCMTQVACSSLGDTNTLAACNPPATTFGDDLCSALATSCPNAACSSNYQAELDADAGWLRSDALDAARTCLTQPSCDETRDCLSAWVSAVE
jgi:hypothetical protein